MLRGMILEGPAFLISVHLGILFSVSYVVAFLANVLDSPSATKSLLGEDTQIQIETRHVCALASVWRARSTLSDLVPHIVGSSGSSVRGPSSPSASATSWSLESLFRKATGSDPSGVLGAASHQNAAPWPLSPGTSGTSGESRGTTSSGELLHDFPGGGSRSSDSFGSMGNDNASSFFTSSSSVSTDNTGAATHRFLLFNLTGLAPSLESLFNAPSPPTPESRMAALALINELERLQAQAEETRTPEHDSNGDSDSDEDPVLDVEHDGARTSQVESVFVEFDDPESLKFDEDAVSHFSSSGRHHVVVTPNQPNLEDLRTANSFYQINYQTAAAQVQPGLSNQGYRHLHDYPQQQRYDCFLRDSTTSRYNGGTSSRPAVDLCAAVCGVYLDLSTTGPGISTKNVNYYPNPFQRPWFSLCHHVFHLVLAVWLLFLFARVEMARITRDQTSLDSYRYPVRKNLALFWGYVLLISFLRTLVLDQKYEQGAAGARTSLNSEGAADIIPWDRWSWSTTSSSREGSSGGQESFNVLKEAAGAVSSSWAAASLNGSTAAKGFYSWFSSLGLGVPWATDLHRDDHSRTAGAGYLQDASEDEPALLTQQQASRSPDDYTEAPTATSTSSSIPADVAPPPPAGRVSSVLGGGRFRLFLAVLCVEVEQTGLLFLVITIAFITLVTVGFVLARVFQAIKGALVFLVRLVCFLCFKTELDAVTLVSQTADNKTDVCAICLCELHPEKELLDEDADLQCVPVTERNADPKNWEWVARSLRESMALDYGLRDCDVLGRAGLHLNHRGGMVLPEDATDGRPRGALARPMLPTEGLEDEFFGVVDNSKTGASRGASSSEEDGDEDLDRLGDVMDDFREVVPGASGATVSLRKLKRQCRRLLSKSKKAVLRVVLGNGFGEGRGEDDGSCSRGGRSGPAMLLQKAKSSGILRQLLQREAARSGPTLQPDDPDHALPSRRWASHEDEDVRVNGEDVYAQHLPHQHQTNYPSSTTPTDSQQWFHSPLSFLSKLRPRVLASFESHFFRRQNALLQLQSCGHKFHASCLEAHFHTQIGRRAKHRSSCPLCRSVNERQVWRSFGSGFKNITGAAAVVVPLPGGGGGDGEPEQVGGQEGEVGEHPFVQPLRGGGGGSRRNVNPRLQHASRVLVEFLRSLLEFLAAEIDFLYFGLLLYVFLIAFSTTILLEFFLYFVSCLTDLLRQFHVVLEHAYTPAQGVVADEEDDVVSAGGGAEVEDVVVDDGSSFVFGGGSSFNRGVDLQDASGEEVLHLGPSNKKASVEHTGSVELPDDAAQQVDGKAEPKMETGVPHRDAGGSSQTTRSAPEAEAEGGPVRRAPPSPGNDQVQIEEVNVEDIAMAALRHAHGRCGFSRSCGEEVDGVDPEQGLDGRAQPFDQDEDLDPNTSLGHVHRDHQPPHSIRSASLQGDGAQALLVEDLEDAVPNFLSWGDEVGVELAEAGVIPFNVPRFKGTVSRDETLEVEERRDGVGNQRQNHTAGLMQTEIPGGEVSREPIDSFSTVDLEAVEEGVAAPALRSSGADAVTRVEDDGAATVVDDAEDDKDPAPELKDKDAAGSSSRAPSAATSPEEDALENIKSPARSVEEAALQQPLRRLSSVMTARDFFALRGIAPSRKSSVKVGSSSSRQTSDVLATSGGTSNAEARRGTTRNDESSKVARVLSYMVQRALRTLTPAAAAHILATVRGPPALYQQSQSPTPSYAASLMMTGSSRAASDSVSTGGSAPPASPWAELDLVLDGLSAADAEEDHDSNATAISSVQVAASGEIVMSSGSERAGGRERGLGESQHLEHLLRDFRAAVGLSLGEAASLPVADLLRLQHRVEFLHSPTTVGGQEHYSDVGDESAYNIDHRSTSDQPQPQVGVGRPPKNLNTSKSTSRLRTRDGGVKLWDLLVANFSKSQLFCLFLTPATFFLVLLLLYEYRALMEFLLQKLAVLYLKFFGDRVEIRVSVSSVGGPAVGFPNDPEQEHVAPGGVDVGGPSSDGSSPAGGGTTGTLQMPGAAGPAAAEFIPSAAISSSAGAGGAASTSSLDEFEFDSAPDEEEEDSTFEGGGGGTGRGRYVTYVCCVTPVLHACCEGARVLYVYAFAPVVVFWKGVFLEACGETLELCAEEVLPWYFSRRRVKMLQNAWKKRRTRVVLGPRLSEEAAGEVEALSIGRDEDVEVVAGEGVAEVGRMTLLRAARMLREKEVFREQLLVQNEMDESEAGASTCSSCASSLSTSAAPAKPNDVREDHVESVRRRQLASTFGKDWNFSTNSYAASPEVPAQGESRRAAVRLRPHEDRDRVREEGENQDHTAKSLEDDRVQFLPYNYILPPLLHSPLRFLTASVTTCAFLVHYIFCFQAVFCFKVLHIFWIKIVVVRLLLAVPMWLFSSNIGVMGALPRSWRRRSRGSAFEPAEVEYDESASEDEDGEAGDDLFVGGDEDGRDTAVVASYLWTLLRKGAREPFRVHNLLPGRGGGHAVRGTRSNVDAEKRNREGITGNEEGRVDAETPDAGGVTAEGATGRSYLLQIAASFYGAVRQRLHFFVPRRFYSGSNNITSFTEILAQNNERVLLFPVGPPRSSPSPVLNESAAPAASSSLQEVVLVRASAVALSLKRRCVLSLLLSYPLAYCMVRWYFVTHVIYLALLFFPLLFARGRGGAGGMDEL